MTEVYATIHGTAYLMVLFYFQFLSSVSDVCSRWKIF